MDHIDFIKEPTTEFMSRIIDGEKFNCPCCERHSQLYKRKIHSDAAKKLVKLKTLGGDKDFVHTSLLLDRGNTSVGDFSKAKHWGLIVEKPNGDNTSKKTSGFWKLTELGDAFVMNKVHIRQHAHVFNDELFGFSGENVNIIDCLSGKGFNYYELMRG